MAVLSGVKGLLELAKAARHAHVAAHRTVAHVELVEGLGDAPPGGRSNTCVSDGSVPFAPWETPAPAEGGGKKARRA